MTDITEPTHRASASGEPINLTSRFTSSPRFAQLFASGMDLIEETAAYLDGEGRKAANDLDATASALYGTESMRLTTRLMQIASWLLLQRSVSEGEMDAEQAAREQRGIRLVRWLARTQDPKWRTLPPAFVELVDRGNALQRRVARLDDEANGVDGDGERAEAQNPVSTQLSLLETAFDRRFRD